MGKCIEAVKLRAYRCVRCIGDNWIEWMSAKWLRRGRLLIMNEGKSGDLPYERLYSKVNT